jgi:hypothetical protein
VNGKRVAVCFGMLDHSFGFGLSHDRVDHTAARLNHQLSSRQKDFQSEAAAHQGISRDAISSEHTTRRRKTERSAGPKKI